MKLFIKFLIFIFVSISMYNAFKFPYDLLGLEFAIILTFIFETMRVLLALKIRKIFSIFGITLYILLVSYCLIANIFSIQARIIESEKNTIDLIEKYKVEAKLIARNKKLLEKNQFVKNKEIWINRVDRNLAYFKDRNEKAFNFWSNYQNQYLEKIDQFDTGVIKIINYEIKNYQDLINFLVLYGISDIKSKIDFELDKVDSGLISIIISLGSQKRSMQLLLALIVGVILEAGILYLAGLIIEKPIKSTKRRKRRKRINKDTIKINQLDIDKFNNKYGNISNLNASKINMNDRKIFAYLKNQSKNL